MVGSVMKPSEVSWSLRQISGKGQLFLFHHHSSHYNYEPTRSQEANYIPIDLPTPFPFRGPHSIPLPPFFIQRVIFRYKYSKDDEEIYKEFMEINNELIPHILKADGK